MPMYEYRCGACGHGFERYAAGKDASGKAEKCPKCGKASVEKVFSTFASSGGCGGGSSQFS